jgi:hypothetical protein
MQLDEEDIREQYLGMTMLLGIEVAKRCSSIGQVPQKKGYGRYPTDALIIGQ